VKFNNYVAKITERRKLWQQTFFFGVKQAKIKIQSSLFTAFICCTPFSHVRPATNKQTDQDQKSSHNTGGNHRIGCKKKKRRINHLDNTFFFLFSASLWHNQTLDKLSSKNFVYLMLVLRASFLAFLIFSQQNIDLPQARLLAINFNKIDRFMQIYICCKFCLRQQFWV